MDTLLACILIFFIILLFYFLSCKIFITLFQISGLKHSVAVFQVFSLFFSIGFTTAESELITYSKVRRKIAIFCMITGVIFNTILTALLISVVTSLDFSGSYGSKYIFRIFITFLVGLNLFLGIFFITKIKFLRDKVYKIIESIFYKKSKNGNLILIGDLINNKYLVTVKLNNIPKNLKNKQLRDTDLAKKGVLVLSIIDPSLNIIEATPDTILKEGSEIELYGSYKDIYNIFKDN